MLIIILFLTNLPLQNILNDIYEDFCNRVEITTWNDIAAKTHLLNILKGVYTKKITDTK